MPSGADASALAIDAGSVRDARPGFCRRAWIYHPITDSWEDVGGTPQNQLMSPAAAHHGAVYLVSGEIRPRTRTREFWCIIHDVINSRAWRCP